MRSVTATNLGRAQLVDRRALREAAKAAAKLILTAADRMEDRSTASARVASGGVHLDAIFREQAA
jgi:hypothetical protein